MGTPQQSLQSALQCLWLLESGLGHQASSLAGKPVDAQGQPLPWYTYPATEYLSALDFRQSAVLEWGCGNSTLWWAARARSVLSIEGDSAWHAEMSRQAPANARLSLQADADDYVAVRPDPTATFDVIVIDGRHRRRCAARVPQLLRPGGLVVLDNADRHPLTTRMLREMNLAQIDFNGFGPINAYAWTTSLFLPRDFAIGRRDPTEPPRPIGGLREVDD
jgi:hypothetical protein